MVMLNSLAVRLRREDGATMVEYGIMVALIAAVAVAVIGFLGADVKAAFQTIVDAI
jgi:pilus assembly protein Flp/PilA